MDGFLLLNAFFRPWVLGQASTIEAGDMTSNEWATYGYGAMFVLGIFVFPFIISHFITKAIRMPAHSFRLGVMLAAIVGGILFAWGGQLKLGPDFKGGTNLVYDIVPDENGEKINSGALASALSDRINPSGTKEISIRPRGQSQIEITVPNVDEFELKKIKEFIGKSGQLEFRIVANTRDHQDIILLAREQASESVPKTDVVDAEGRVVGRWYTIGREERMQQGIIPLKTSVIGDVIRDSYTGKILSDGEGLVKFDPPLNFNEDYALEKWLKRKGVREIDVLMALEMLGKPYAEVSGDDLASAQTGFEKTGRPIVEFRLNTTGAGKMLRMTSRNQPDGEFHRRMAIIMDKKVLSAPQLNSPISNSGQIVGQFTKEEVDFLVTILRSGRLPATLGEVPASENRVGAGLGATTVQKGVSASTWAVIATFFCIIAYYWFAGLVASMALIINGLLIFGVMIFIGQPLTLPGLAGLVLTVGMSVDANVLIFERIREEKNKGSAPRMSIRNGFDRAFTTIVDSNLTTLIAAIVLYWIGTDQVRGFAVALIIGIATSMFTATFCSRIVFEIAEKLKIVSLSMFDGVGFLKRSLLGASDINFMGWQKICMAISISMITAGIVAVAMRGEDILNIDFTGGTSVTFQLQEPVGPDELRKVTREILVKDENDKPVQSTLVRVEKEPIDTVYTLVTSIDDVQYLSKTLLNGFAETNTANLVTYRVTVLKEESNEPTSRKTSMANKQVRFVTYQSDGEQTPVTAAEDTPAAVPENAAQEPSSDAEAPAADASSDDETNTPGATGTAAADETATPGGLPQLPAEGTAEMVTTSLILEFGGSNDDMVSGSDQGAKVDGPTLKEQILAAAKTAGVEMNQAFLEVAPEPLPPEWRDDDVSGFAKWSVKLPVDETKADAIVVALKAEMQQQPKWLSLSQIGTRVAGEMQQRAIAAILLSLVFIVAYIWFRFQKVAYGLAAVVALVHDVLITLGIIALCHWIAGPLLTKYLLIEDFKIGLTEVAAFLTIIGYSLNDTIVVFDRIREVRGRSPRLTAEMINDSVNQTLSRTLLTSGTTLLTVFLLYVFGGEGIHAFAFALLIGVLVGTYSSIFVAAPLLLWISSREAANQPRSGAAN